MPRIPRFDASLCRYRRRSPESSTEGEDGGERGYACVSCCKRRAVSREK
jgi:hypothetical protein